MRHYSFPPSLPLHAMDGIDAGEHVVVWRRLEVGKSGRGGGKRKEGGKRDMNVEKGGKFLHELAHI